MPSQPLDGPTTSRTDFGCMGAAQLAGCTFLSTIGSALAVEDCTGVSMTELEFHAVLLISVKGRLGSFSSNGTASKQTKDAMGCWKTGKLGSCMQSLSNRDNVAAKGHNNVLKQKQKDNFNAKRKSRNPGVLSTLIKLCSKDMRCVR